MKIINILIFIGTICIFASADDRSHPYYWFLDKTDSISKVIIDTTQNADTILSRAVLTWKRRDGAIGIEISNFIASALVYRPAKMLWYFSKDTTQFTAFLLELPQCMFTDYSGGKKEKKLNKLRLDIIGSVEKISEIRNDKTIIKIMAKRLLEKLNNIKIRIPD
jgi:hypothetical protein